MDRNHLEGESQTSEALGLPAELELDESFSDSAPEDQHFSSQLVQSPWFWSLAFVAFALAALLVIGPKYSRRQAGIETKFRNQQTALAWEGEEVSDPAAIDATRLPEAGENRSLMIPLAPLITIIGILFAVSIFLFLRKHVRPTRLGRSP